MKSNLSQVKVSKAILTKKELLSVPTEIREFLIFSGHIVNELNWLNKLLLAGIRAHTKMGSLSNPSLADRAQLDGYHAQNMIAVRLYASKIFEAKKFLWKHALEKTWFRKHSRKFAPEVKASLKSLRVAIHRDHKQGKQNPLHVARNKFGNHYASFEAITASSHPDVIPPEMEFYIGRQVANRLYLGCERCITGGLISLVHAKRKHASISFDRLIKMTLNRGGWLLDVYTETLGLILTEDLGLTLEEINSDQFVIKDLRNINDAAPPWFMEITRG